MQENGAYPKTLLWWSSVVSQDGATFVYLMYFLGNILWSSWLYLIALPSLGRAVVIALASPLSERYAMICLSSVCVQRNVIVLCQQRQTIILKKKTTSFFSACSKTSEVHRVLSD